VTPVRPGNPVFASLGTTVFETMSRLADRHGAVNLGQGFPDDGFPEDLLAVAADATLHGPNQYPSMLGLPDLRRAVAEHDQRFYGIEVDPDTEVLVTSGATEALAACLLGLLSPGDVVVLFEPMYDCYVPMVRAAGAVPRFVTLRPPTWELRREDLAAAFGPRTRAVVLNDPLNPAAKVFSPEELDLLAEFVLASDAHVVCDEVYEHLVYDGRRHVPLWTRDGMADRCLKVGSAGKTFSLTGWKVGYVTATAELLRPVVRAHQFLTFTTPPNLQAAVAVGLRKDDTYFVDLAASLQVRRDRLAAGLRDVGFEVLDAAGTYFLDADFGALSNDDDRTFAEWLVAEVGVATIPLSAFYESEPPRSVVRFCFCKRDATIDTAIERLSARLG